jgi:GGDEF domain-containing protein
VVQCACRCVRHDRAVASVLGGRIHFADEPRQTRVAPLVQIPGDGAGPVVPRPDGIAEQEAQWTITVSGRWNPVVSWWSTTIEDNIEIIATRLRFGAMRYWRRATAQALALVNEHAPDLILLDVMLPDIDGYEISRRIKGSEELPFIPIILVTARDSTQDKVAGLDAGADDYLTKPINFPELEARVRSMLRIKRLQDELEEKNRELERLSISDGLTGLFNHRHIHGLLAEEFERVARTEDCMSVAMFDLDHFKAVNDTYGHQAGDRVLVELADILRETARDIDRLGRYGGEEFMALLPETCIEDAPSSSNASVARSRAGRSTSGARSRCA